MKQVLWSLCLVLCAMSCVFAQDKEYKIQYKGATTTAELKMFLETSTNPAIKALDAGTKASLVKYMVFSDKLPRGFSGTDANIAKLKANANNHVNVLSAIFQKTVVINNTPKPHPDIKFVNGGAEGKNLPMTVCDNCGLPRDGDCCHPDSGDGCFDSDNPN